MKNNVGYYRHENDAHNHWKFRVLRSKYGWAGEGRFWALNNLISRADRCQLNITTNARIKAICVELDLPTDEFEAFVAFLTTEAELIINDGGLLTTRVVQECLNEVDKRRIYQRGKQKKQGKTPAAVKDIYNAVEDGCTVAENVGGTVEEFTGYAENLDGIMPEKQTSIQDIHNKTINICEAVVENEQIKVNEIKQNKIKLKETISAPSVAAAPAFSFEEVEAFRMFSDWVRNKAPCVSLMKEPFTLSQFVTLTKTMAIPHERIRTLVLSMHNWAPLLTQKRSAYHILLKFKQQEDKT